jgi:broad specificity phosphatase PhoE
VLTALFILAPDVLSLTLSRTYPGGYGINLSGITGLASGSFHRGVRTELRRFPARAGLRPMPGRIVLLRHGATEWSETGRHTGRTDIPLLPEGCEQAKAAGLLVRQFGPATFGQVLTSPLVRAEETCTLAGFVGQSDPDLVEWDYGAYEGLTTAEIRETRPGWTLWDDGVPEGETAADVGRRADRVIQRARELDTDTLCVAHGHVLRVLTARWLGLPPVAGRLFLLRTGAVCVLGWELDWPAMEAWNIRG